MCKTCFFKIVILFLIIFISHFTATSADFFVSPTGNDTNTGSHEMPFKTIEKAILSARDFFQQNENEDCIIWLSGGEYFITNPLELNSAELKPGNNQLYFRSMAEEKKPSISGGKKVTGWNKNADGLWEAEIIGPAKIRELFIDNK